MHASHHLVGHKLMYLNHSDNTLEYEEYMKHSKLVDLKGRICVEH